MVCYSLCPHRGPKSSGFPEVLGYLETYESTSTGPSLNIGKGFGKDIGLLFFSGYIGKHEFIFSVR